MGNDRDATNPDQWKAAIDSYADRFASIGCFACGTDGAFPATISSRLNGRAGSTRASIRICAGCWDRATLPESRASDG
jgi:hypothetical protein